MQVTSKGRVAIPQEIRNRLGLLPLTKVAFELAGDRARVRKAGREAGESARGRSGARCSPRRCGRPDEHGRDHGIGATPTAVPAPFFYVRMASEVSVNSSTESTPGAVPEEVCLACRSRRCSQMVYEDITK